MRGLILAAAALLLPSARLSTAEQSRQTLLPTSALARDIRLLQGPNNSPDPKAKLARLRHQISMFISRQIEAYPSISECSFQKQLATAFAIKTDGGIGQQTTSDVAVPRVFAEPWGPGTTSRVFVVSYGWFGFYGKGGSQTVLESYVWTRVHGVSPGSGFVPPVFNGPLTQTEEVCRFPNLSKYWLLVSGTVGGSSGRALGGSAAVFEIGPEQIKAVWNAPPGIGNVMAYAHTLSQRWDIEYADTKRLYNGIPDARLLDIYQVNWPNRTFRQLIHRSLE